MAQVAVRVGDTWCTLVTRVIQEAGSGAPAVPERILARFAVKDGKAVVGDPAALEVLLATHDQARSGATVLLRRGARVAEFAVHGVTTSFPNSGLAHDVTLVQRQPWRKD
jgi:hypothetical protein